MRLGCVERRETERGERIINYEGWKLESLRWYGWMGARKRG